VEIEPDDDDVMHDASEYQPVREPGEEPGKDIEEWLEKATQEFHAVNAPANGNGAKFRAFWSSAKNIMRERFSEAMVHEIAGVDSLTGWDTAKLNKLLQKIAATMKNEMAAGG
jgi:type I site-specific restriction endonuclease